MQTEREAGASVVIRNVSGEDYSVAELGGAIFTDNDTIDLMDDGLPLFYDNWVAANDLVTRPNVSQLWVDIQAGNIEVVESRAPVMKVRS